ncbi:MAG: hypothetical protein AVDCRST_MAG75-250, partial [uncultured Propionibacteriaceae bacterium]
WAMLGLADPPAGQHSAPACRRRRFGSSGSGCGSLPAARSCSPPTVCRPGAASGTPNGQSRARTCCAPHTATSLP